MILRSLQLDWIGLRIREYIVNRQSRTFVLVSLLLALCGCLQQETPTSPPTPSSDSASDISGVISAPTSQLVNGYQVTFDGRSLVNRKTTFAYIVTGTGAGSTLDRFVIQIPPCAVGLLGSTPPGGHLGVDPSSGLFGLKWDLPLGASETRRYTITFSGDMPLGAVQVAVRSGGTSNTGLLPGPCQGAFVISGTVFIDNDASGTQNPATEPGIGSVTVQIGTSTTVTDAAGHYQFTLNSGTYSVGVPVSTAAVDFNEQLAAFFAATGPTTQNVTIGPNATNIAFGYKPQADVIVSAITSGALPTTGLDEMFWTDVLYQVKKGGTRGGYDAAAVLGFLNQIEGQFLPIPYQFTDGQELHEAYEILTDFTHASLPKLLMVLLATELNDAAGRGLTTQTLLQDVLITWGESLILSAQEVASLKQPIITGYPGLETDIQSALRVFNGLNQRGGGDIPD